MKDIARFSENSAHVDTLMDESFYDRLGKFMEEFTDKKGSTAALNMRAIITDVKFEYVRTDNGKGASNGTKVMLERVLLSLLLSRLIPKRSKLLLPIAVDEVADIDSKNTKTLLKALGDHGFTLFAATPEVSGGKAEAIGHWITLGDMVSPKVVHHHCTIFHVPDYNEWLRAIPDAGSVEVAI
jgi:hypothetical protein